MAQVFLILKLFIMYVLSDILAVINSNLELERKQRNIEARGHLSLESYTMNVGEDVVLDTLIHFFIDSDHDYPVLRVHHIINKKQLIDKEKEFHRYDMMVLDELWKLLKFGQGEFAYEKFVDGTYNYIDIVE